MEEINEIKLGEIEGMIGYLVEDIIKAFIYFELLIIYAYVTTFLENDLRNCVYIIMMLGIFVTILMCWQAHKEMKEIKIKIKEIKQNLR
ncbi:MAG: hypothetical protein BWK75_01995 [Candidatus Altiarchaeales archaeon A3]|nr:MAG: hypothetical protein BWK75_01995 [Candidatus Altiarchaeales archaeon A3]